MDRDARPDMDNNLIRIIARRKAALLEADYPMQRFIEILRRWTIQYGPAVLPTLAAGAIGLLLGVHAVEQVGAQPVPSRWAGYIPWTDHALEWMINGILICITTGCVAFPAYVISRKYRAEANLAVVAGGMTVAVLTWATQWCSTAGGISAGLLIAGVIGSGVVCVRGGVRRRLWNTIKGRWSDTESEQTSLGIIQFAQIIMALYFGAIALIAISGSVPEEFRWKVLTFAGIGITAASVLSDTRKLNNLLAMLGVGIGLWGGYIEMNRAATLGDGQVDPATVMLFAGIVIYFPLTALAIRGPTFVRIMIAPMLVAGLAFSVVFLATVITAAIIGAGCNLGAAPVAVLVLGSAMVSFVVGAATFAILTAIEIVNWLRNRNDPANPSESE